MKWSRCWQCCIEEGEFIPLMDSTLITHANDVSEFEAGLAKCQSLDPFTIRLRFKSDHMCMLCQLKIRTMKHLATISHRRIEICVKLFVLQQEMNPLPSSGCLTELRDLLRMKRTEDCYLLSTHSANWPAVSNTGLADQRGKSRDGLKLWFTSFLSNLERTYSSLQGTELSAIAEDIVETISNCRKQK